jgi:hypothetical protein
MASYIVQPGDTLSLIAQHNNVGLDALLKANPQISNPNYIVPGQQITLPNGQSNAPTPHQKPAQGPALTGTPPWMYAAWGQHHLWQVNENQTAWQESTIKDYMIAATGAPAIGNWCSAFVYWCMKANRIKFGHKISATGGGYAGEWVTWAGGKCVEPRAGAIGVMKDFGTASDSRPFYHVGFVVRTEGAGSRQDLIRLWAG